MKFIDKLQKLIIFLLIYFVITIRNDGYFPFNSRQDQSLLLLVVVVQVLLIFFLLVLFFSKKQFLTKLLVFIEKRFTLFVSLISILLILTTVFLFYKNYLLFKEYYSFNIPIVFLLTLFSIFLIAIPIFLKQTKIALAGLFTSSFLISLIPISYFPIISKIGDLLPIISKQIESFLAGKNIYQYYLLDNGVLTQAVRQPGTTLSYLPAYILNIDLRFMGIFFTFLTALLFIKLAYENLKDIRFNKKFLFVYLIIALILLSPYRLNRLDVYEPVFWFLITLIIYLLKNKKFLLASASLGIGILTQVWFWLFTPLFAYYIFKKATLKTTIYSAFLVILFGVLPLGLFILRDANEYLRNVFGYYGNLLNINEFNTSSFYLTPIFLKAGLKSLLTPLQVIFSIGIFIYFAKLKIKLKTLLTSLILIFFFFIQFNSLTWNYMYLNLFILLAIYLLYDLGILES